VVECTKIEISEGYSILNEMDTSSFLSGQSKSAKSLLRLTGEINCGVASPTDWILNNYNTSTENTLAWCTQDLQLAPSSYGSLKLVRGGKMNGFTNFTHTEPMITSEYGFISQYVGESKTELHNYSTVVSGDKDYIKILKNIFTLYSYENLPANWNTYGANPISLKLISNALDIIYSVSVQPKIFPTGRNSVQFEYKKANGDYLEFEIYEDRIEYLKIINDIEEEDLVSKEDINAIIIDFYA